jgi:hypothetical protein
MRPSNKPVWRSFGDRWVNAVITKTGKLEMETSNYTDLPEVPDYFENDDYKQTVDEVGKFIEGKTVVTISDIVSQFPEHERIIFSLLEDLQSAGRVYWEEWRPLPTMIYAGDKRIPQETYKYNWHTARDRTWKHKTQDLGTVG